MSSECTALQSEAQDIRWSMCLNLAHSLLLYGLLILVGTNEGCPLGALWGFFCFVGTVKTKVLGGESSFQLIGLKGRQGV